MPVEALPGFEDFINYNNVQEQPDLGGIYRPSSLLERTAIIAKPISPANEVLSSKFNHDSKISLTLSWSRDKGLKYGVRRGGRRRPGGCHCVIRGISHRCGDRTGTIINFPKLI